MNELITRAVEVNYEQALDGERAVVARINNGSIDRLNTIIDPLGCDVSHFNRSRSVLWHHGQDKVRGMLPIGEGWAKVRRAERDMIGKVKFDSDDFSELCWQKCKSGSLRSWSIKAKVKDASPPTKEELRANPDLSRCAMIYRSWELIEFSLTPEPGNSECNTLMVSRGFIAPPEGYAPVEAVVVPVPEESKLDLTRHIESDGTNWYVMDHGKRIATFDDPELAEECLRVMGIPATLNHQITVMVGQMRGIEGERRREVKEYIDLYRYGRV
jgi:hypothetical protein